VPADPEIAHKYTRSARITASVALHTHTHTHARARARTHARTRTRIHVHMRGILSLSPSSVPQSSSSLRPFSRRISPDSQTFLSRPPRRSNSSAAEQLVRRKLSNEIAGRSVDCTQRCIDEIIRNAKVLLHFPRRRDLAQATAPVPSNRRGSKLLVARRRSPFYALEKAGIQMSAVTAERLYDKESPLNNIYARRWSRRRAINTKPMLIFILVPRAPC